MPSEINTPHTTIHIGHGKTGSSAIQAYLARSADVLAGCGVSYPFHRSFEWAREGRISSGNGRLLFNLEYQPTAYDLFSDETLYAKLDEESLAHIMRLYPGGTQIICYTRDFFDHAISAWGQNVKRASYKEGIEPFIKNVYGGHLKHLLKWFEMQESLNFSMDLFNYSRHKDRLIDHFIATTFGGLGKKLLQTTPPMSAPVNRSLTLAEYELQRLMNVYFPKKTFPFVSDVLVNELPEVKSERPAIPRKLYEFAKKKFMPDIEAINLRLTASERIVFESLDQVGEKLPNTSNGDYQFSQAQLEVYVRSLANAVVQPDIGRLERMLASHERKEPIQRSDAAYLASVLQLLRPENEDYAKAHSRLTASSANPHPNGMSRFLQAAKRVFRKP